MARPPVSAHRRPWASTASTTSVARRASSWSNSAANTPDDIAQPSLTASAARKDSPRLRDHLTLLPSPLTLVVRRFAGPVASSGRLWRQRATGASSVAATVFFRLKHRERFTGYAA